MNKLNVFNHDWYPWKYPSNWFKNVKYFFRQCKWAYQRATRGYCDYDCWDLDSHLTHLMAQSIKDLADNTHGYPGTDEFPTYESWKRYLYKIVYLLNYSLQEDMYNPYTEVWEGTWENKSLEDINKRTPEEEEIVHQFLDYETENEKKKRAALNQALEMITHVWGQLWD